LDSALRSGFVSGGTLPGLNARLSCSISKHTAGQGTRRVPGTRHESHQRTKTPSCRRSKKMKTRDRRFESSSKLRVAACATQVLQLLGQEERIMYVNQ